MHRYLHQYRFESALKSLIGQVAYSVTRRHLERKRIPIAEPVGDDELAAAMHAEIEALPPLQRTVLTLYHLEEVPIGEITRITGLTAGTIKSHLFRCRAFAGPVAGAVAGAVGSEEMNGLELDNERGKREREAQALARKR